MRFIVDIFKTTRARPIAVVLLLYQFFFFDVFLPGHTRGSITLDGKHTADAPPCCCCCCRGGGHANAAKPDSKNAPSKHDKEECAICHFAARVLPTQFFCIVLPELGFLEMNRPARPSTPVVADLVRIHHSRGPPACL